MPMQENEKMSISEKSSFKTKLYIVLLVIVGTQIPNYDTSFRLFDYVIPLLVYLILNRSLDSSGLFLGDARKGIKLTLCFFVVAIPLSLIFFNHPSVFEYYRSRGKPDFVSTQLNNFVSCFSTEYLFRGFLLFTLLEYFGRWDAIFIQVVPYAIIHFGKPAFESFSSIIVGVSLGYLASETKSIWYGVVLHYFFGSYFQFLIIN